MIFRNDAHGVLFEKEIRLHKGCGKRFTAALFLLTADYRLWQQVEPFVGTKHIDIESARPQHLNGLSYVCFALAKDILTGSRTVVLGELADPSLLSPRNFMVVLLAMFIRAYGLSAANQALINPYHAAMKKLPWQRGPPPLQKLKDRTVIFITLAILPWVGGKQALFKTIIKRFPSDYRRRTYVEVFGGGGTMLPNKDRSVKEIFNDANGNLDKPVPGGAAATGGTHAAADYYQLIKQSYAGKGSTFGANPPEYVGGISPH